PTADLPYFPGACAVRLGRRLENGAYEVAGIRDDGRERTAWVLRALGRTVLPPAIFDHLHAGESDLGTVYAGSALPHRAVVLEGQPWDLGTTEGYRRFEPTIAAFDL